jgi:hypothetical protein
MISVDSPSFRTLWMGGTVHIEAKLPLAETARLLAEALSVSFLEDTQGTYDEFPAWTATAAGLEFVVLGIPAPEYHGSQVIDDYELQIHSDSSVYPRTPEETARFHATEISEYFARIVHAKTGLRCRASEYPNTV